jgi:hypothetical protein
MVTAIEQTKKKWEEMNKRRKRKSKRNEGTISARLMVQLSQ